MSFDDGTKIVQLSGGSIHYYEDYTTTNLYVERVFGGGCHAVTVTNDSSTDAVQLSWDGATLMGELKPPLETQEYIVNTQTGIYVKGTAGGGHVRIWGT